MGEHNLPGQEPDVAGDPAWLVRLRAILTPARRARIYRFLAALGAVLVFRGVLTGEEAGLWLDMIAGVLMAGGGVLAVAHTPQGKP